MKGLFIVLSAVGSVLLLGALFLSLAALALYQEHGEIALVRDFDLSARTLFILGAVLLLPLLWELVDEWVLQPAGPAKQGAYPAVLGPGEDGLVVASCPAFAGCITQGRTRSEALTHLSEAIALCLDAGEIPAAYEVTQVRAHRGAAF